MCNKQTRYALAVFLCHTIIGNITMAIRAEVAHFKLACVGNLAFKGDPSRNVICHWLHGAHIDNNPVIGWVENKER